MAAVIAPPKRRRFTAVVIAWIVLVAGLSFWSARSGPATVAEQRDITAALPELDRAYGELLAAADGPDRGLEIGALRLTACELTPVWAGTAASRDLLVYVRGGDAPRVLESIAAGLPGGYGAETGTAAGGTRVGLHADAGEFVGIDVTSNAVTGTLPITVSTGCRPGQVSRAGDNPSSGQVSRAGDNPTAGEVSRAKADPVWVRALEAAGAPATAAPTAIREITCPAGATAATYVIENPPALDPRLGEGATVLRTGPAGGVYLLSGNATVTVEKPDAANPRMSVTRACT